MNDDEYKQDTDRNSEHTIKIEEDELGQNFDLQNNSTFETSIAKVDGVADIDDGASVNGVELSDGKVSRTVGAGAMIDFIAEDLTTSAPDVDRSGATTVLNASVRADVDTNGNKQLTIETNSDWETGTYRYVYLDALENNKSALPLQPEPWESEPAVATIRTIPMTKRMSPLKNPRNRPELLLLLGLMGVPRSTSPRPLASVKCKCRFQVEAVM
ncbi:hypothetical protein [Halobellus marinus]|uniref:hypothetical protein n=1 Tax=Halobellus marinus TaxID=3075123 RepID=UPI0028B1D81D|nr:hypothetical protein [Halobellus sp. DFY28]